MESLLIEPSSYSPQIDFDSANQNLKITGSSYMEHPVEFYEPVIDWINEYFQSNQSPLQITIHLKYFNSGSSGLFYDIFTLLEEKTPQKQVKIDWIVDPNDEEMFAEGEEFMEYFDKLDFNIIQK